MAKHKKLAAFNQGLTLLHLISSMSTLFAGYAGWFQCCSDTKRLRMSREVEEWKELTLIHLFSSK